MSHLMYKLQNVHLKHKFPKMHETKEGKIFISLV